MLNTGGTIEADANSIAVLGGGVSGGTLRTTGNGTITLSSGGLLNVAVAGNLQVSSASSTFFWSGTVSNSGTISFLAGAATYFNPNTSSTGNFFLTNTGLMQLANSANVFTTGNVTLSGGGTISLGGSNAQLEGGSGPSSLLSSSNVILGQGAVGSGGFKIANSGTITATSGTLVIQPFNASNGLTNTGLLSANGGLLQINGITTVNAGGIIQANANSVVAVNSGVTGGSIAGLGGGTVTVGGGIQNVAFSGNVQALGAAASSFWSGTTSNTGTLTIVGDTNINSPTAGGSYTLSNSALVQINASANLFTNGAVVLAGAGNIALLGPASKLGGGTSNTGNTLTNNNIISGQGNIGGGNANIVNNGTIAATINTLTLQPFNISGSLINNGLLQANGGMLVVNGVDVANAGGVIEADNNSIAAVNVNVIGGSVRGLSGGTVTVAAAIQTVAFSGNVQALGTTPGNFWSGTASNSGTLAFLGNTYLNTATANGAYTLSNIGLLQINNSTSIFINGSLTLSGGGSLILGGASAAISAPVGGLFTTDNRISGSGTIVVGSAVNSGTVSATTGTLTLNASTVNSGLLRANGGVLQLQGNFTNTAGVIEADNNSLVTLQGTFTGGVIQGTGGTVVLGASATLQNLSLAGQVDVPLSGFFTGAISNSGTLAIEAATFAVATGNATLTGGGRVLMNSSASQLSGSFTSSNFISGQGLITGVIGNTGTITATTGTLTLAGPLPGWGNTGILRANGGVLLIQTSQLNNAGGTIEADTNSVVTVASNVTGGNIAGLGGTVTLGASVQNVALAGQIQTTGTGVSNFWGGTITNAGTISLLGGNTYFSSFSGGNASLSFNNSGLLQIAGGSNLVLTSNVNFAGGGTVSLQGPGATLSGGGSTANTLTNNNVIAGQGNIGNGNLNIINNGTITATSATLTIQPYSVSGSLVNSGLLSANGGLLVIGGVDVANTGGVIQANANSVVAITSGVLGGSVAGLGGGTVTVTGGIQNVAFSGNIQALGNTPTTFWSGTASNAGTLSFIGNTYFNNQSATASTAYTLTNLGLLQINNSASLLINGPVTLAGGGSVSLLGPTAAISGAGNTNSSLITDNLISGQGMLTAASLFNSGTISATAGTLTLAFNTATNTGALLAVGGGQLNIQGGTYADSGGIIEAASNSIVNLTGTFIGGLISGNGGTVTASSGTSFQNLSLNGNIQASAANFSGAIFNAGSLSLISGTTSVAANSTINNAGTIVLGNAVLSTLGTVSLTGGGTLSLANTGSSLTGVGPLISNNLITGQGTIAAVITNLATIAATGGTLSLLADANITNNGTLSAASGELLINAGQVTGGSIVIGTGGTLVIGSTVHNFQMDNSGLVMIGDGSSISGTINNHSQVQFSGTIDINADSVLTGGGSVLLTGATLMGAHALTSNNLIFGTGSLQTFTLSNSGTINAAGGLLQIMPGSSSNAVTNTGLLSATSGTLALGGGGTVTNTGGTIQANANSLVTISSPVSGGNIAGLGGGTVTVAGGIQNVAFSGNIISNGGVGPLAWTGTASNVGTLTIASHTSLNPAGATTNAAYTLTNLGLIHINDGTTLGINGPITFTGGGSVFLAGANAVIGADVPNTNSTLTTDNIISGQGMLAAAALFNSGTISATTGTLTLAFGSATNTGELRATSGGKLNLQGGTYANTGGTIEADTNSVVAISGNVTGGGIAGLGGTVTLAGGLQNIALSGLIQTSGTSLSSFWGGSITNAGTVGLLAGNTYFNLFSGGNTSMTFGNNGLLQIAGGSSLVLTSNVAFSGGGTVSLQGPGATLSGGGGTANTLTNNNVIVGQGNIGDGNLNIINNGTITATAATLTIQPYSVSGSLVNSGLLSANGGMLVIDGVDVANTGGVIEADANSVAAVNVIVIGGSVRGLGGTVTLAAGIQNVAFSGNVQSLGTAPGTFWTGTASNAGTLTIAGNTSIGPGSGTGSNAFTLTNIGLVQINNSASVAINSPTILAGGGTLSLLGPSATISGVSTNSTLTTSNFITGQGSIAAYAISNSGTITATAGTLHLIAFNGNGTLTNTGLLLAKGGTLDLEAGSLVNTGGTIQADANSLVNAANIIGGSVAGLGGGSVSIGGSVQNVAFVGNIKYNNNSSANSWSGAFSNAGTLTLLPGAAVYWNPFTANSAGGLMLSNSGLLQISSTASLFITGNATLAGGGSVALLGPTTQIAGGASTLNALTTSNVISGQGVIGKGDLALTNLGTITATAGTLAIQTYNVSGSFVNSGLLLANGGTLLVNGADIHNAGGIIEANPGSTAILNATVLGGTIEALAGGTVTLAGGAQNVTFAGDFQYANTSSSNFWTGNATNSGTLTILQGAALYVNPFVANATSSFFLANTGLIQVANSGSIFITGGMTLAGGGNVLLQGPSAQIAGGASTFNSLSTNNVISGQGIIGNGDLALTNTGTITATSGTLALQPYASGVGIVNAGLLSANGGRLLIAGLTTDNTAGTIQANANSVVAITSGVLGGSVAGLGGGTVTVTGGMQNVAFSGNIQALGNTPATFWSGTASNAGTLSFIGNTYFNNQSATASTAYTLTNLGLVQINNSASLFISGPTTLAGGGSVSLRGPTATITGAGTTNSSLTTNNLISGQGTLTAASLFNSGTISASTGTLTLAFNTATNTGALLAVGGGQLNIQGGTYADSGGIIEAASNSIVNLTGTFIGGLISGNGGTVTASSGTSFQNLSLNGNIQASAANFSGAISNAGSLSLISGTTSLAANSTINNAGTILLGNAGLSTLGTVSLTGGGTLLMANTGSSLTGVGPLISNNLITGQGTIAAVITNLATIAAIGGTLSLLAGANITNNGTLSAASGELLINAGQVTGGSIVVGSGGTLVIGSTVHNFQMDNSGLVLIGDGSSISGTINNHSQVQFSGTTDINADSVLTGGGSVLLTGATLMGAHALTSNNLIFGTGSLQTFTLSNSGTINAAGGLLQIMPGSSSNAVTNTGLLSATSGTLALGGGGTVTNIGGTIQANANSLVTISSPITGGNIAGLSGGTVTVAGGIQNVAFSGNIQALGASAANFWSGSASNAGTLTFTGNTSFNATGATANTPYTLTNIGLVQINNTSSMILNGPLTLAGGGTVALLGPSSSINGIGNTNSTLITDNVILGQGTLTANSLANSGTISATLGTLTLSFNTATNTGSLRADGGLLNIQGGAYTNTGGIIEAVNGSIANLLGTFNGGTLRGNGGTITATGSAVFQNLMMAGNIQLSGSNSFSGAITNSGTLSIGSGTFAATGTGTLTGGGNILLTSASSQVTGLFTSDNFTSLLASSVAPL